MRGWKCILQLCMAQWVSECRRVLEGKGAVEADFGSVFVQCNTVTSLLTGLFALIFDVLKS